MSHTNPFRAYETRAALDFLAASRKASRRSWRMHAAHLDQLERLAARHVLGADTDPTGQPLAPPGFYDVVLTAAERAAWWLHPTTVAAYGIERVTENVKALRAYLFACAQQAYSAGLTNLGDAITVLIERIATAIQKIGEAAGGAFKAFWGRSPSEQIDVAILAALGFAALVVLVALSPGGQTAVAAYGMGGGSALASIGKGTAGGIVNLSGGAGQGIAQIGGGVGRGFGSLGEGGGRALGGMIGAAVALPMVPP